MGSSAGDPMESGFCGTPSPSCGGSTSCGVSRIHKDTHVNVINYENIIKYESLHNTNILKYKKIKVCNIKFI